MLIGEVKTLKRKKNNQRVEKDTDRLTVAGRIHAFSPYFMQAIRPKRINIEFPQDLPREVQ